MSGVKKLTSYFKKVTKDEREVEELLATQLSRNSRTASIESAKTISTLSSAVMSVIDLTASSSDYYRPGLNAIAAAYESDDPEYIVSNVLHEEGEEGEVEFICTVDKRNSGCVGDTVINALDTVIGQTSLVFSNEQPHSHRKNSKRVRRKYNQGRPDNWCMIAEYYNVYGNVAGTIKHFSLKNEDMNKNHMYWTTTFGRWIKELTQGKLLNQCGGKFFPPYGMKIDLQSVSGYG